MSVLYALSVALVDNLSEQITYSNTHSLLSDRRWNSLACVTVHSCNVTLLQYDIVLLLLLVGHVWWEVIYLIFCHSVAVPLSCCYNMAHLSVQ